MINWRSMSNMRKKQLYFPALLILVAVILLLVWIIISTYRNLNRDREQALDYIYQQGIILIDSMESFVRTALNSVYWTDSFVGQIIEETAKYEDIAYIYLIEKDGRILYFSSQSKERPESVIPPRLANISSIQSRIKVLPDGSQIYDMAKRFVPVPNLGKDADLYRLSKTYPGLEKYRFKDPMIVVGINMETFEAARKADFHHAAIMAAIVIALGVGALFFIFVIQNYYMVDRTLEKTRDYTKEVEERARQSEKLAAVGKLAAGVAHEIRNPLSSIRGFAHFLSRSLEDRAQEKEYADIMLKEVDRINIVVSDLLTLSRPATPELVLTNIEELINHAVRLVGDDAKSRSIQIHKDISPNLENVRLDANQITQALLNLLLNAIQVLDTNGNITIGVHPAKDLEQIVLWVEDDGPGVSPEIAGKIFDPFVTTREDGSGLGLAIVHTIVKNHMGDIHLDSPVPGKAKGSRFTMFFPIDHDHNGNL